MKEKGTENNINNENLSIKQLRKKQVRKELFDRFCDDWLKAPRLHIVYMIVLIVCAAGISVSIDRLTSAIKHSDMPVKQINQTMEVDPFENEAILLPEDSTLDEGLLDDEAEAVAEEVITKPATTEAASETVSESEAELQPDSAEPFKGLVVASEEDALDQYIREVRKRVNGYGQFMMDSEITYFIDEGYVIRDVNAGILTETGYYQIITYYYPIVMTIGGRTQMVYTGPDGYVQGVHGLGWLHMDTSQKLIYGNHKYALIWGDGATMEMKVFGNTVAKMNKFPGVFVGISKENDKLFFRRGYSVYAVDIVKTVDTQDYRLVDELIAEDVAMVVDVNYYYTSDRSCVPLFQMRDGSLKMYLETDSEDEPSLRDPIYEGNGYARISVAE